MGFNNPDVPWHEIERTLSDRPPGRDPHQWWATPPDDNPSQRGGRHSLVPEGANGGDSPAWSSHRPTYEPPARLRRRVNETPYAELHCHSNFSFLDGASHPEELAEEGAHLGLAALGPPPPPGGHRAGGGWGAGPGGGGGPGVRAAA